MGKAPCCEKVGLKKGRWTVEEDEILTKYIQAHGEGSWRSLPKNAGLLRCGKSCRLRWINYLRPELKRGNITAAEEDLIVQMHRSFGNRWSLIATHLPGRSDNEIKNYWNSTLSRKISSFFTTANPSLPTSTISSARLSHKRRAGRVSRSVAKKYINKKNSHEPFNETPTINPSDVNPQNWAEEQPTQMGLVPLEQIEERDKGKSAVMLEPIEGMNDQVMGHSSMLEGSSGDSRGIWDLNEEIENALMGLDSAVMSNDESESGGWGSSCGMGLGVSGVCSSPMNECFGVEWDDHQDPSALCDEGEYALLWSWESDIFEVENLS